jgi:agmatinase
MRKIGRWFGLEGLAGSRQVDILGCPFDGAATGRGGAASGPTAIREWSASQQAIDEYGHVIRDVGVEDHGDVSCESDHVVDSIRAAAAALVSEGRLLLGLGGDHSVTIGLGRGVAECHGPMGLVMLDAHADCFPEYEGDPLSHACTVSRLWDSGAVDPARTALVGLRSYGAEELARIGEAGLVVPAAEWLATGSAMTGERVRQQLGAGPVYLSIDIDVLDPAAAPGTGYPVAGGPDSRSLLDLLAVLQADLDIVAADLVEVAPPLDASGITAAAAAHVLLQFLAGHAGTRSLPASGK